MWCQNANPTWTSVLLLASVVDAQLTNWEPNQATTSLCRWDSFGAALVNGTVYLDGGYMTWSRTGQDGVSRTTADPNDLGYILSYDLGASFSPDTNKTGTLVKHKDKLAKGRQNQARGPELNFLGGALLANDHQFYQFGGTTVSAPKYYTQPESNEIIAYYATPYGGISEFHQTFDEPTIKTEDDDVHRWIAHGGAANSPSENKAWYFSGLMSPSRGPIYSNYLAPNTTFKAGVVTNALITLDMTYPRSPRWTNDTTLSKDTKVKGRAGSELVWVPINKQGILVALGGVTFPDWTEAGQPSSNPEKSKKESPEFMQTIDIYDVESKKWYRQSTQGGPPGARARGCAVVAYPSDYSSFNIYYYGGYDGLNSGDGAAYHDDVWVLSLPSFTWVELNKGSPNHARSGHRCVKPYADQMLVFGGFLNRKVCLPKGPVENFNLSSGEWMDTYDPTEFGNYRVPEKVQDAIGTKTAPTKWASSALEGVFKIEYDYSRLPTNTPYPVVSPPPSRPNAPEKKDGGGMPSWLAPVLGVVLGLVLLTAIIVLFCLWRKRKFIFKRRGPSEPGTEDVGRMRIYNWVRHQQTPQPMDKAFTVTSEEMPATASEMAHHPPAAHQVVSHRHVYNASPESPQEMYAETARAFELPDTPQVAELGGLGFTHQNITRSHSKRGAANALPQSWSAPSSNLGANSDFNDTVSQASGPTVEPGLVDSPTLARSPAEASDGKTRCTSDVSMITNHTSHLRNTSDATVSSEGTHAEQRNGPERMSQPMVQSIAERFETQGSQPATVPQADVPEGAVSPPTSDEVNANEYFPPLVSPIMKTAVPNKDDQSGQK